MQKLLIADSSEDFVYALETTFQNEYEIRSCRNGEKALELLRTFRPDAMILNIMLPVKDGFTVLQEAEYLPQAILGLTNYLNDYIAQRAMELRIKYLMISPCLSALRTQLADLLQNENRDLDSKTANYLRILNVPSHRDGYRQLCAGIPLFAKDPGQRLSKELYPAIARVCGDRDGRAVEHGIRRVIEAAWKTRDRAVWEQYFPGIEACPSNKVFIARLAEQISKTQ